MRTPTERAFLSELAARTKGRCGYSPEDYEKALPHLQGLIDDGLIVPRRLGLNPGFQILPAGRAYLNPTGDQ